MRFRSIACTGLLLAPFATLAADPAVPQLSADECAVWQREQSFARSVAEHDAAAFAQHVGEHAAFGASTREPTRGRDAIARRWAPLIEGKRMALRWYPTRVTIAPGIPDTAWSSGPSLFEVLDPGAGERYHLGAFHSVAQGRRRGVAGAVRRWRGTAPGDGRRGGRVHGRTRRMRYAGRQAEPQLTSRASRRPGHMSPPAQGRMVCSRSTLGRPP